MTEQDPCRDVASASVGFCVGKYPVTVSGCVLGGSLGPCQKGAGDTCSVVSRGG